jgi:hypothetical protein
MDAAGDDISDAVDRASARQFTRWPFPRETIDVFVGGQTVQSIRAVCSNLSASGLGLLTTVYVAPGTSVIVSLPHALGGTDTVRGEVVRCTTKRGERFDVGVRLRELIDPMDFVRIDPFANMFVYEEVDPEQLVGSFALASTSMLDKEIWTRAFRGTRVNAVAASDALSLAQLGATLDLVAIEVGDENCRAGEVLLHLVKHGFCGRVMLIAPEPSDAVRHEVYKLPSHAVLLRPYDAEMLRKATAQALGVRRARGERDAA